MYDNGITPQIMWTHRPAPRALVDQSGAALGDVLPLLTGKSTQKTVFGTENFLFQELICLYQTVSAAYERSQRLQAITRPFLTNTIWKEAAEVARRGGKTLPTTRHTVSILRLDIANFTELMDYYPLEQLLAALNSYLDVMTQVVHYHHGEVNKYLGDGFFAIFAGADDAVRAGSALQQTANDFNQGQMAQGGLVFPTRIAIDSGQVVETSLGSADRQDRTVMGMPVNMADRLQTHARPGQVLLSQATFDRLQDQTGCRSVGSLQVKGRQEPVSVYEKLSGESADKE